MMFHIAAGIILAYGFFALVKCLILICAEKRANYLDARIDAARKEGNHLDARIAAANAAKNLRELRSAMLDAQTFLKKYGKTLHEAGLPPIPTINEIEQQETAQRATAPAKKQADIQAEIRAACVAELDARMGTATTLRQCRGALLDAETYLRRYDMTMQDAGLPPVPTIEEVTQHEKAGAHAGATEKKADGRIRLTLSPANGQSAVTAIVKRPNRIRDLFLSRARQEYCFETIPDGKVTYR
jgi:hypothetical protein